MIKTILCIFTLVLSSCAYNDHSRNFTMDTCSDNEGVVTITVDAKLEKSGEETSKADNKPDISPTLSIPASVL